MGRRALLIGIAVAAWMFHLCLRRRPETFLPAERGGALPAAFVEELRQDAVNIGQLLADAFRDPDLFDLIHCLAAEVEYPGRRLEGERRIGVDAERQPLRREALGTLLMMASELALDPTSLDGVLLSQLGTNDPLEPAEILETLARAQWNSRGSARLGLDVTCRHPAVDQALRLQVDELSKRGAWLQRILENEERNTLKSLRGLRWLFDVDDLKPEKDENGQPRYTTPHLRFHLAQDEVRELLLGEQIYNNPSLAIRELYQNALDACRYRQAREEYLKRKGLNGHLPPWEGKIVFRQRTEEDGREILECEDNGVGMGRRELWRHLSKWQSAFGFELPAAELFADYCIEPRGWDRSVLYSEFGWIDSRRLTPGYVWDKSRELGSKTAEILKCIHRWAKPLGLFHLELPENLTEPAGYARSLLSEKLKSESKSQWLSRGPLDPFHILCAADRFDEPVSKILSRLDPYIKPFGLEIPEELYRMP